jgi:hypothetical protein
MLTPNREKIDPLYAAAIAVGAVLENSSVLLVFYLICGQARDLASDIPSDGRWPPNLRASLGLRSQLRLRLPMVWVVAMRTQGPGPEGTAPNGMARGAFDFRAAPGPISTDADSSGAPRPHSATRVNKRTVELERGSAASKEVCVGRRAPQSPEPERQARCPSPAVAQHALSRRGAGGREAVSVIEPCAGSLDKIPEHTQKFPAKTIGKMPPKSLILGVYWEGKDTSRGRICGTFPGISLRIGIVRGGDRFDRTASTANMS